MTARERQVRKNAFAHCAFSAAVECAEKFMCVAQSHERLDEFVVPTALAVLVTEDFTDPVRRHDALEFHWYPRSAFLPAGRALLTVRPHAPQGSQLQFSISYVPPFGVFGRIFDVLVGKYIAARTCSRVLRRLKKEIEEIAPEAGYG